MRTNRAGDLLKSAGSKHDLFLYIRPECLDEAEVWFTQRFGERILVRRTTALVEDEFFWCAIVHTEVLGTRRQSGPAAVRRE